MSILGEGRFAHVELPESGTLLISVLVLALDGEVVSWIVVLVGKFSIVLDHVLAALFHHSSIERDPCLELCFELRVRSAGPTGGNGLAVDVGPVLRGGDLDPRAHGEIYVLQNKIVSASDGSDKDGGES